MKETSLKTKSGKDERLSLLLTAAADTSMKDSDLHDLLSLLTVADIDWQCPESSLGVRGSTALHVASGSGHSRLVRLLLDRGANVTLSDHRGRTPLHWAARRNRADCAVLLVSAFPGLVNWQDYGGHTPLHAAAATSDARRLAEVLLSCPVLSVTPLDNRFATPLHVAASAGSREVAELLLQRRVSPGEWRDERGATPLHYAALSGHWDLYQRLSDTCEPGGDLTDNAGLSPLLWACLGRDTDAFVAPYVQRRPEAAIGERTPNGACAAHLAAMGGRVAQLAAIVAANEASAAAEDVLRLTPLHYAAASGQLESARLLVAHADRQDLHGRFPLHWAARGGHARLCRLLLSHDAATAADRLHGHAPIHLAAAGGGVAALAVLLEAPGCWTERIDAHGCSPLHLAAAHDRLDAAKLLLDRLPRRKQQHAVNYCRAGVTALDVALHRGGTLLCQLLIERGGRTGNETRRRAAVTIQRAWRVRK